MAIQIPAERLKQFMSDNDALMQFWKTGKNNLRYLPRKVEPSFEENCPSANADNEASNNT